MVKHCRACGEKYNGAHECVVDPKELFKIQDKVMQEHEALLKKLSKPGGTKFDSGKAPMHHIRLDAIEQVARVFAFGESKYPKENGLPNYLKGMQWTRLIDASMRHIMAWKDGESRDPESNQSHLAHAACCLLMLLTYEAKQLGVDDRFVPVPDLQKK